MSRVVLIGLDGGTFTVLEPLMAHGVMPFLSEFMRRSVRARLRTVTPPLTPPGWTSLMTGKRPGQHGVFDFFQKESPDSEYLHMADSSDIRSDTIWSLASRSGRRVIALNFPLTFPPPDVNGCVVPGGWMPWRQLRLGCHPPGLFDRLKALPSFNARELAMDMQLEEKALEGCANDEYADWITLHTRREGRWSDILQYLLVNEPADLVGIVFDGVDKLQHLCWRFLDPACRPTQPSPWERDMIELCETYFRQLDRIIERIVDAAGDRATVLLASDHGAGPTTDVVYLNTWLEWQGYLRWRDVAEASPSESLRIGIGQITRHVYELDWERTLAYASTPSSFGIHLAGQRDADSAALGFLRNEIAQALAKLAHPATGQPLVERIETREEAFSGPYAALGPDLSLSLANGAAVSILRSNEVVKQRALPLGSHRPEGIFVAAGPELRAGVALDRELSITDVAPLVLHQLGLPVPHTMSGCVRADLFQPESLVLRPVQRVAGEASAPLFYVPHSPNSDPPSEAESDAVIVRRLRALGYVE